MKILVTGGAGFIGSFLVERLVDLGHEVIVVDNMSRGLRKNLAGVVKSIKLVEADISENGVIDRIIEDCEVVYHLAGVSQVMTSVRQPNLCFSSNVLGTHLVLKACAEYKKKLVFTSSREVYGNPDRVPVTEEASLRPLNPYAASKISGEAMIRAYGNTFNVDYVILRLANVIGQRDFDRVVPIFMDSCLKNEALTIFGGQQILDLIDVKDVIEALIRAQSIAGESINIGSGTGIGIKELAQIIKRTTNSKSKIMLEERRKEEVERFIADISKAKKIIGWEPKSDLEETIKWATAEKLK